MQPFFRGRRGGKARPQRKAALIQAALIEATLIEATTRQIGATVGAPVPASLDPEMKAQT